MSNFIISNDQIINLDHVEYIQKVDSEDESGSIVSLMMSGGDRSIFIMSENEDVFQNIINITKASQV